MDQVVEQARDGVGAELDPPAAGLDVAGVVHPRDQRPAQGIVDLRQRGGIEDQVDQPVAGQVEHKSVAAGQGHLAQGGADEAAVRHLAPDQRGDAAVGDAQGAALVDAGTGLAGLVKAKVAGHEIGIADVGGAGQQPTDMDLRALAKQHAARVDQEHAAVGADAAQQRAGVAAQHPVQGDRAGVGLLKLDRLARTDVKAAPVDHCACTLLLHPRQVAGLRDLRLARSHRAAYRAGPGHRCCGQRQRATQRPGQPGQAGCAAGHTRFGGSRQAFGSLNHGGASTASLRGLGNGLRRLVRRIRQAS